MNINYYNYSRIPQEIWHQIFSFIPDERTLARITLVCKAWKEMVTINRGWGNPYRLIWKEEINCPFPSQFYAIFKQRFFLIRLGKMNHLTTSMAEDIDLIRRGKLPISSDTLSAYLSFESWLERLKAVIDKKDSLTREDQDEIMIYIKEIKLITYPSGRFPEIARILDYFSDLMLNGVNDTFSVPAQFQQDRVKKEFWFSCFISLICDIAHLDNYLKSKSCSKYLNLSILLNKSQLVESYKRLNHETLLIQGINLSLLALNQHSFYALKALLLIEAIDFDQTINNDGILLHWLCSIDELNLEKDSHKDYLDCISLLVQKRACRVLERDADQLTPLMVAAQNGNYQALELMLSITSICTPQILNEIKEAFFHQIEIESIFIDEDNTRWHLTLTCLLKKGLMFEEEEFYETILGHNWVLSTMSPLLASGFYEKRPDYLLTLLQKVILTSADCCSKLIDTFVVTNNDLTEFKAELNHFLEKRKLFVDHLFKIPNFRFELNSPKKVRVYNWIEKVKTEIEKKLTTELAFSEECLSAEQTKELITLIQIHFNEIEGKLNQVKGYRQSPYKKSPIKKRTMNDLKKEESGSPKKPMVRQLFPS